MSYPPHLSDATALVGRLWSIGDLLSVFPNDVARATLPWPRARRMPGGHLLDRAALEAEFAEALPVIALLDPRTLWASQPYVTRAGVEYYLSDRWFRTGETYADQHMSFNRLPVVERRADGADVLLGGHHRSCAALLAGEPVLARCIVHSGRDETIERVDLRLPAVAVGPWSAARPADTAIAAVDTVRDGERVSVPTAAIADATRLALRNI